MLSFKKTSSDNQDFRSLVSLLDAELKIRDGEDHAFFAQFNKLDLIKNVIVCYSDETPIGCGAFKFYEDKVVEIKRMFVKPDFRNKGIAGKILRALELWAKELNYSGCILETGQKQPEAIHLYKKSGYNIIPNYGQYKDVLKSVCMIKSI